MHQLEGVVRAQGPQRLDDTEAQPTAAVDRDPGGLVEHQELLVLVDDRLADAFAQWRRRLARLSPRQHARRRDEDSGLELQECPEASAAPLYANRAPADDAVDAAAWQPRETLLGVGIDP